MPSTLRGLIGFIVVSTLTFMVGSFIYSRFVSPALGKVMQKAA